MREKEYSEWMGKQGFDALRHANCCKIAFNGGWESRQTEVDELQKRVDLVKRELKAAKEGHYGFNDEGADLAGFIFDLEQALKGGGK